MGIKPYEKSFGFIVPYLDYVSGYVQTDRNFCERHLSTVKWLTAYVTMQSFPATAKIHGMFLFIIISLLETFIPVVVTLINILMKAICNMER